MNDEGLILAVLLMIIFVSAIFWTLFHYSNKDNIDKYWEDHPDGNFRDW